MKLYQKIENPPEGTPIQYLGVYILRWKPEWGEPSVGFVEISEITGDDAETERIRITTFLSYDTVYSDDFCIRCSHEPTNCECTNPVYMVGWAPSKELEELKAQLFPLPKHVDERCEGNWGHYGCECE